MKTDRPHDEIEELIAADALDGLDPADRDRLFEEMASHGPDCPDCRRLLDEYHEVAGWLALALPPAPVPAEEEERLMQAARADAAPSQRRGGGAPIMPGEAFGAPVPGQWPSPKQRRAPSRRERERRRPSLDRWRRWAAAASVAAVVALVAGALGWAIAPREQGVSARSQFISFVGQPGTRVVTLVAGPGRTLAVAYRSGESEAWIVGNGIPDPSGDRVYELWYRSGTGSMQPAGTFVPKDGTIVSKVDVGTTFDTLAVSIEPRGGSKQPTTKPIYLVSV